MFPNFLFGDFCYKLVRLTDTHSGIIILWILGVNILFGISPNFRIIFISLYNYLAEYVFLKAFMISLAAYNFPVSGSLTTKADPYVPSPSFLIA